MVGVRGRRVRARVFMTAINEYDLEVARQMSSESGVLGERVRATIYVSRK